MSNYQVNRKCHASVVVEMPNKICFSFDFRVGNRGDWIADLYPVVEMLEAKYAAEYPECKVHTIFDWDQFDPDDK